MSKREENDEEVELLLNKLEKLNTEFDKSGAKLSNFRKAKTYSNIDSNERTTSQQQDIYMANFKLEEIIRNGRHTR
jgi:hypothetical protein